VIESLTAITALVMTMFVPDVPTVKPSITIVVPSVLKSRAIAAVPAPVAVAAPTALKVSTPPETVPSVAAQVDV
jgi:hypothetical protein